MPLPPNLAGQLDVLIIDNFDSFTWNLYQQFCLLGAKVTVVRNDVIHPQQFPELKIKSLVISPGPGHPQTDSGISKAAIEYFQGKVPILGVCMGLECLVDMHGGTIGYAGEIMHGKVSRIRHDGRGCFRSVSQGIKSTRYHSLSASYTTLPACLALTAVTEESGVIMGVRHRQYTVEAVQYHPESVMSEEGDRLIRNFLALKGGLWEQNPESLVLDTTLPPFQVESVSTAKPNGVAHKVPSILEKIYLQRISDVAQSQTTPGATLADLESLLSLHVAPPLISFVERLKQKPSTRLSLLAEIKRASPSKGPIAVSTSAASQALKYALAGAQTISVLTEPKWFLGSLQDMLHARTAIANLPNRPAILRKDFILSRYQVLESRIWGADTILLIVSMLPESLLRDLYSYSLELGMEPLVEVNNAAEMELALSLSAKVIGVNNRNLHDFQVDMETTSRFSDMVKEKDVVLCALSGISTPEDIQKFAADGVQAVLIGENLMRAKDPKDFIQHLFSESEPETCVPPWQSLPPLVKICGIRTKDEALAVAEAQADMLGLMFVPTSKRYINIEVAKDICHTIRTLRFMKDLPVLASNPDFSNTPWFTTHAAHLSLATSRPLLVGVFQNAPLDVILHTTTYCQLDLVQLHGSEPSEWAKQIPVPVIRVFHIQDATGMDRITEAGTHKYLMVDAVRDDGSGLSGGSGKAVDFDLVRKVVAAGEIQFSSAVPDEAEPMADAEHTYPLPVILAGGLTNENIRDAILTVQPWAVDVSTGVETEDGRSKDLDKVRSFIAVVKGTDK